MNIHKTQTATTHHNQSKATTDLFSSKMIIKLEMTSCYKSRNQRKPHTQWEQQQTLNKIQQNHYRLEMNSSLGNEEALDAFYWPKFRLCL